jgi:hypothetical protein
MFPHVEDGLMQLVTRDLAGSRRISRGTPRRRRPASSRTTTQQGGSFPHVEDGVMQLVTRGSRGISQTLSRNAARDSLDFARTLRNAAKEEAGVKPDDDAARRVARSSVCPPLVLLDSAELQMVPRRSPRRPRAGPTACALGPRSSRRRRSTACSGPASPGCAACRALSHPCRRPAAGRGGPTRTSVATC